MRDYLTQVKKDMQQEKAYFERLQSTSQNLKNTSRFLSRNPKGMKIEDLMINKQRDYFMKTIQITIDPELLDQIDNDDETKKIGRSAFLRAAVRYYLEHTRRKAISEKYRSGYSLGLKRDNDLLIWEDEQVWPPT